MARNETKEDRERGDKYGLKTMEWHGWGSPVGLGLFILAIAGAIWIIAQI